MARRQDISARLDFIARRDFICSLYSDRPKAAPTPAPDARDHFERPLSCFYDKNCLQSISPGSSSPHSFFHDLLVSNNLRAFDDCIHDSSRSRPHTVHLTRVEQTGNALQESPESPASTDPLQFLFKMRQCGETLEQYFRDQCDKTTFESNKSNHHHQDEASSASTRACGFGLPSHHLLVAADRGHAGANDTYAAGNNAGNSRRN